ncbi:MAG: sigma 54-interacting transcriptional regulator [Acidobacteriota bacterium]
MGSLSHGSEFAPFLSGEESSHDRVSTLYRTTDVSGRAVALRVFARNSGLPADPGAMGAYARLVHPHLQRLHAFGTLANGGLFAACEWAGGTCVAELREPLPTDVVRRTAFQMSSALSFLHARGLTHGNVGSTTVMISGEESLLTRPEWVTRRDHPLPLAGGASRPVDAAASDVAGLGRTLLEMCLRDANAADLSDATRLAQAISAVHDPQLRSLVQRMLGGRCTAEYAFSSCLPWMPAFDACAARSCVGHSLDRRLASVVDATLAELRRGHSFILFIEGRWGTERREMLDRLELSYGASLLALHIRGSGGPTETARVRIDQALRHAVAGLRGDAPIKAARTDAGVVAQLAAGLLQASGRPGLLLSIEIDDEPDSDDPAFLAELLPHLRQLPFILIAHAPSRPRGLPEEIAHVVIEYPSAQELVERFFLPGPAAERIKKRLAVDSGGNVELFREGLSKALMTRGADAVNGNWKGGGSTILASNLRDLIEMLPDDQRAVLSLLAHAITSLPREFFAEHEWGLLRDLQRFVTCTDAVARLRPEARRRLARAAGTRRAGCTAVLARLEERRIEMPPLTMAWLLAGAGRQGPAIASLKQAGMAALATAPRERVSRLFARLARHAGRTADIEFWRLRGDWAVAGEQFREAIGYYRRAVELAGRHDPDLMCRCARSAESAADYRLAVRTAEEALDLAGDGRDALGLRCIAARCRYLLGDIDAAKIHWATARVQCDGAQIAAIDRGICMRDFGHFLYRCDRSREAREVLEESEGILRQIPEAAAESAKAIHYLGFLHRAGGDLRGARACFETAGKRYAEAGCLLEQGKVASDLGLLHMEMEQWPDARRHLEISLELFRRIRNRRAVILASFNLAEVMLATGEYEQARRIYDRCMVADRASGSPRLAAYTSSSLGTLAFYKGDLDEASRRLEEALEALTAHGDRREVLDTLLKQFRVCLAEGAGDAADLLIQRILPMLDGIPASDRLNLDSLVLRAASLRRRDGEAASQLAHTALESCADRPSVQAQAHLVLAEVAALAGRGREMSGHYRRALAASDRCLNPHVQLEVRMSMLAHAAAEALRDPGFCGRTEDMLDRSGNQRLIRLYREWSDANRAVLGLPSPRRFAPPGIETEVYKISRRAGQGSSDESVAALIVDAIIDRLGADRGVLALKSDGGLRMLVSRGALPDTAGYALDVLTTTTGRADPIVLRGPETMPEAMRAHGVASALAVPVFHKGQSAGAIYLERRGDSDAFTKDDAEFVAALADGLALGLRGLWVEGGKAGSAERHPALAGFITHSEKMLGVLDSACRVAARDVNVLITGESGTGKELLARAIHEMSGRRRDRFVPINCGAIPENLLESEFFGYCRGAFTDARADRAGLIEEASGGTLFLDEIGEMPMKLQAKLLRVVQEREFRRIGETRSRSADVRFVCATNRDLAADVAAGRFREDLFYRLQVVTLTIPPLRERREDVMPLVEHFVALYSRNYGITPPRLGSSARNWIQRHPWGGNVRELQNALQRALLAVGDGAVLEREHFHSLTAEESIVPVVSGLTFAQACSKFERAFLTEALRCANGSKTVCARDLGLSRQGLFKLMKKHGL